MKLNIIIALITTTTSYSMKSSMYSQSENFNINSISNQLNLVVQGRVDILIVTETKLDSTFPTSQFITGTPWRFDRNGNGSGVLIYNREDIPSKLLADHKLPHDIELIFVELNLRKKGVVTFWVVPSA